MHLHSIMLLLYPHYHRTPPAWWHNLHSIMLLLYPLWSKGNSPVSLAFTFHYASTLSLLSQYCLYPDLTFTFHYASTLSLQTRPLRLRQLHLHSIMLLLYPWRPWSTSLIQIIYIPLCFYFIVWRCREESGHAKFTFHYASTLSDVFWPITWMKFYLHSIMLLLYQLTMRQFIVFYFHLHSIMLLLYRYTPVVCAYAVSLFTFHYASTLSNWSASEKIFCIEIYIPLCFYFIDLENFWWILSFIYIPLCFYFIIRHHATSQTHS